MRERGSEGGAPRLRRGGAVTVLGGALLLSLFVALAPAAQPQEKKPEPRPGPPSSPVLPPGHPQVRPQMPPGHPPVGAPATTRPAAGEAGAADQADVASIDALVAAYYDTVSGPRGEPRDWDRFRSLFMDGARFVTGRPAATGVTPLVMSPEQFIESNGTYFERGGYFESELSRKVDAFGGIAQVFSTYASRRGPTDPPYSRDINSMQLLNDGKRWWIATIMWDFERPPATVIPAEYLPAENAAHD